MISHLPKNQKPASVVRHDELDCSVNDLINRPSCLAVNLQIEDISNFITSSKELIDVILGMGSTETEADARQDERGGGVSDNNYDDGDLAFLHQSTEERHFSGVEREKGDDGGIVMTEHDKAELVQGSREISCVESQSLEAHSSLCTISELSGEGKPVGKGWEGGRAKMFEARSGWGRNTLWYDKWRDMEVFVIFRTIDTHD
jgi:hypothetical protein